MKDKIGVLVIVFLACIFFNQLKGSENAWAEESSPNNLHKDLSNAREYFATDEKFKDKSPDFAKINKNLLRDSKNAEIELIKVLSSPEESPAFRAYSARMLAKMKTLNAVPLIVKIAENDKENEDLRAVCVLTLTHFEQDIEAENTILSLAEFTKNYRIKRLCLNALSKIDSLQSVEILSNSLEASDTGTKIAALNSLGELGVKGSNIVKEEAKQGLQQAGKLALKELGYRRTAYRTDDVSSSLNKNQYRWISAVIHQSVKAKPDGTVDFIKEVYKNTTDDRLKIDAVSVLGGFVNDESVHFVLLEALEDNNPKVRMIAGRALLVHSNGEAVDLLQKAVEYEQDTTVREDILRAIKYYKQNN